MELFSTTPYWMEAFGKMLIHSIWAGLLLFVVMKLILTSISQQRSQLRYLVSLGAMGLYTSLAVLLFLVFYKPATDPASIASGFAFQGKPWWFPGGIGSGGTTHLDSIWTICFYLYVMGICLMILRLGFAASHLRRIRTTGEPVGERWNTLFMRLTETVGIPGRGRLLASHLITVPGVIGWIKPVVVVPVGMLAHLPADQVETILLHELYHLKRYDFLVNAIQTLLEGLFFYNPAVWMISRAIRQEREHCCDDLVLDHCHTPLPYAKALYQISSSNHSMNRLVPAAGGTRGSGLSRRIFRILNYRTMKTDIRDHLLSFMVFVSGVIILLVINGLSTGTSAMKPMEVEHVFELNPSIEQATEWVVPNSAQDTVPAVTRSETGTDRTESQTDEEIDQILEEAREAHREAIEDIDWEEIKRSVEEAKTEALQDIDWEEIKRSVEEAKTDVLQEIDWEKMKIEMEQSMKELQEIDWEKMKIEMEQSMKELQDIDWEKMRLDVERSLEDIDIEGIREEIENSMNDIDWDEIRMDLENIRIHLDSMKLDLARNPENS